MIQQFCVSLNLNVRLCSLALVKMWPLFTSIRFPPTFFLIIQSLYLTFTKGDSVSTPFKIKTCNSKSSKYDKSIKMNYTDSRMEVERPEYVVNTSSLHASGYRSQKALAVYWLTRMVIKWKWQVNEHQTAVSSTIAPHWKSKDDLTS